MVTYTVTRYCSTFDWEYIYCQLLLTFGYTPNEIFDLDATIAILFNLSTGNLPDNLFKAVACKVGRLALEFIYQM